MEKKIRGIILIIFCTFLITAAQVLMKKGIVNGFLDPITLLGAGILIFGGIVLMVALRWGELSILHPMLALGFVWVTLSAWFMGEAVTVTRSAGIVCVVAGSALLSWRSS